MFFGCFERFFEFFSDFVVVLRGFEAVLEGFCSQNSQKAIGNQEASQLSPPRTSIEHDFVQTPSSC